MCVKFLVYRKIKCLLRKISRSAASVALLPQAGGRKSGGQEFAAERSRIWGSHTRLCYAFWESSIAFLPTAGFKQRLRSPALLKLEASLPNWSRWQVKRPLPALALSQSPCPAVHVQAFWGQGHVSTSPTAALWVSDKQGSLLEILCSARRSQQVFFQLISVEPGSDPKSVKEKYHPQML